MSLQRRRINREFSRNTGRENGSIEDADAPRTIRRTVIDFTCLGLPTPIGRALAEAFWSHMKAQSESTLWSSWQRLKIFARFVSETRSLSSISDIRRDLLLRYIEWLNCQKNGNGRPWSNNTRSRPYITLCVLLKWLLRCRPGLLGQIDFPSNPFPWRDRDAKRITRVSSEALRAILKACERDIIALRTLRTSAEKEHSAVRASGEKSLKTLGGLLDHIDQRYDGLLPHRRNMRHADGHSIEGAVARLGGTRRIEPCLYPRAESLVPYYLAILIHTAGNPDAISKLSCDCLQPVPLIEDRELLVWKKSRARVLQRRSFRSSDPFEPPTLVREILEWTHRLRPHAPLANRDRLFLFRGNSGVNTLTKSRLTPLYKEFAARHGLPSFTLAAVRPSVLSAFYRASGDLRTVKRIANHAHISTTVSYVQGPEVEAQNRSRVAALQRAWMGHLDAPPSNTEATADAAESSSDTDRARPAGTAVSLFGFNCKDPFGGVAQGTRQGELCTHFLACLTCPNAIIGRDALTLARLLQARDHLRDAAGHLHPARWAAIYAPQLRILEEDILSRFSSRDLVQAELLRPTLPSLLPLR